MVPQTIDRAFLQPKSSVPNLQNHALSVKKSHTFPQFISPKTSAIIVTRNKKKIR